jgi:hypothetical protein
VGESCRTRRAVRAWHHPPAGAAFQLCDDCLPDDGPGDDHPDVGRVIDLRDRAAVDDQADDNAGDVGPGGRDQVVTGTPGGGVWW